MIKNVYFFDFDNTIVKQPDIYEWGPDEEDGEFMDTVESLECDFELNSEIENRYRKADGCDNSIVVILTNRTIDLKDEVLQILSEHDITFDSTLFREKDRSKGNRLNHFLEVITDKYEIENVYFWDDKPKHIKDVDRISDKYPDINFKLNLVI